LSGERGDDCEVLCEHRYLSDRQGRVRRHGDARRAGLNVAEVTDSPVEVSEGEWDAICEQAQMTEVERSFFWGRQFLNRYAFAGYSRAPV